MTDTRFLRCINDPARGSLCDTCDSALTCSGMSDEVDARIREWELHRAARLGVCSHMPAIEPQPEPRGPGLLASRAFWVSGLTSAVVLAAIAAAVSTLF